MELMLERKGNAMKDRTTCPATRVVMMPYDTNGMGNIFGGAILSHIDLAGAVEARSICRNRIVTVSMKEVVFKKPVHVSDVLTCWAEVTRIGRTSITTHVEVEVERQGKVIPVTEATVVYVAVDNDGKPTPVEVYPGKRICRKRRCQNKCSQTGKSKAPASNKGKGGKQK